MSAGSLVSYDLLSWAQARSKVFPLSPPLARMFDDLDLSDDPEFVVVRYPFGATLVSQGRLNTSGFPPGLLTAFSRGSQPVGLVLKHQVECHYTIADRLCSYAILKPGCLIGLPHWLQCPLPYTATAGARSLFMLPKISLAASHKKLRQAFQVQHPPPQRLSEHWHIFKSLTNSRAFPAAWDCEVLLFSPALLSRVESGLLQQGLPQSLKHLQTYYHTQVLDLFWERFCQRMANQRIRFNPYILETVKHLLSVAFGIKPASCPAFGKDWAGPITTLQKIYTAYYQLKELPTIFQPEYFSLEDNHPVYYSLQAPTLLHAAPINRNYTSTIDDMRAIKECLDRLRDEPLDETFRLHQQPLQLLLKRVAFDFFHSETYAYGTEIRSSLELPEADPRLLYSPDPTTPQKFAYNGPLIRGCVRISLSQTKPPNAAETSEIFA